MCIPTSGTDPSRKVRVTKIFKHRYTSERSIPPVENKHPSKSQELSFYKGYPLPTHHIFYGLSYVQKVRDVAGSRGKIIGYYRAILVRS